jgi:pSer/pThr/pTyr-binding forkhead associated (FHA) protein
VPLRLSIRAPADDVEAAGCPSRAPREVEVASEEGDVLLGRASDVTVQLPYPKVSLRHARIFREADSFRIEDLGSSNGTRLAGRRLTAHCPEAIALGEIVGLGGVELRIEGQRPAVSRMPTSAGTQTLARRLVHDLFEGAPPAVRARFLVLSGLGQGRELVLASSGRAYKVGRGEACDLILQDEEISREHAAFERGPDGVVVRDLGSKNGVEVAGELVANERLLRDGDIVRVGETRLRLLDPEERYLRQMEAVDAELVGAAAVPRAAVSSDEAAKLSRLPAIATVVAVAALLTTFGFVLALAFVVHL